MYDGSRNKMENHKKKKKKKKRNTLKKRGSYGVRNKIKMTSNVGNVSKIESRHESL